MIICGHDVSATKSVTYWGLESLFFHIECLLLSHYIFIVDEAFKRCDLTYLKIPGVLHVFIDYIKFVKFTLYLHIMCDMHYI